MDLIVTPSSFAIWGGRRLRCALGRAGVSASKREGDGATPIGRFALRRVLYRADRLAKPETALPARPLRRDDAWCDTPADRCYNRPVQLPYHARCEALWRRDHLYDLVVILGYNDTPVRRGGGSAIFLHVARPGFTPTGGCIALSLGDLRRVVGECGAGAAVEIVAGPEKIPLFSR